MAGTITEIEKRALAWPEKARAMIVRDQDSYSLAANILIDISNLRRNIQEHHAPIKQAAHKAHQAAVAAEKKLLDPLIEAEQVIKKAVAIYMTEQEARRQAIEKARLEQLHRDEEERRIQTAIEIEGRGGSQEVINEILDKPTEITPTTIAPTYRKVEGVSTRETWRAELTDIKTLCQAIADGKASTEFVMANMTVLNAMARAQKGTLNIPGVKAIKDIGVQTRTAVPERDY